MCVQKREREKENTSAALTRALFSKDAVYRAFHWAPHMRRLLIENKSRADCCRTMHWAPHGKAGQRKIDLSLQNTDSNQEWQESHCLINPITVVYFSSHCLHYHRRCIAFVKLLTSSSVEIIVLMLCWEIKKKKQTCAEDNSVVKSLKSCLKSKRSLKAKTSMLIASAKLIPLVHLPFGLVWFHTTHN